MFGIKNDIRDLSNKVDEYHKTVMQNHVDLMWIKRIGLVALTVLGPVILNNSCKGSSNAGSNTIEKRSDDNTLIQRIRESKYW